MTPNPDSYTTPAALELIIEEGDHGPSNELESYHAGTEAGAAKIECTTDEREDFERETETELLDDCPEPEVYAKLLAYLRENFPQPVAPPAPADHGKWSVSSVNLGGLCEPIILDQKGAKVCSLPALSNMAGKVNFRAQEIAANAKKIAAAPELLGWLERVAQWYDLDGTRNAIPFPNIVCIREVIAKATT